MATVLAAAIPAEGRGDGADSGSGLAPSAHSGAAVPSRAAVALSLSST